MSPHFEAENAPTGIDLFAGCGGGTFGLTSAGFNVRAAWEIERNARYTYHVHHCEPNAIALHGDATTIRPGKVPDDLGLLFAGPECQGFSAAGGDIDPEDPRNEQVFSVVEWVVLLLQNQVFLSRYQ
jgi:DNA (cytosine-5)-methyltransferase 1